MEAHEPNSAISAMPRRNFLKWGGAGLLAMPFLTRVRLAYGNGSNLTSKKNYWKTNAEGKKYCIQKTVYDGEVKQGYIWARVDGWWRRFQIRNLEETYWNWHFSEMLRSFEEQLSPEPYEFRAGGPHSPSVATYGNRRGRGDSSFHLNSKIIGLSAVPTPEHIKEINATMLRMIDEQTPFKTKVAWLKELHEQDIWRKELQPGVEYFTTPEFETHTFLNLMENPVATLCFQGRYDIFKSFEIRCIAQVLDPRNPAVSEELLEIVKFPAILHGFYHNNVPEVPAVLYWPVEEFDNTVKEKPGQRLVKLFEQKVKSYFA